MNPIAMLAASGRVAVDIPSPLAPEGARAALLARISSGASVQPTRDDRASLRLEAGAGDDGWITVRASPEASPGAGTRSRMPLHFEGIVEQDGRGSRLVGFIAAPIGWTDGLPSVAALLFAAVSALDGAFAWVVVGAAFAAIWLTMLRRRQRAALADADALTRRLASFVAR